MDVARLPAAVRDGLIAARICAADPTLGGIVMRGADVWQDDLVAAWTGAMAAAAPVRRIPAHIDDDRLLGGIDLTATLALGRPVSRTGLLAEAHGGLVTVPMAERLDPGVAGRIATVIDTGELLVERDGATMTAPARFGVIAFDDGREPDDRPPIVLSERLAFHLDAGTPPVDDQPGTAVDDAEAMETLVATAAALGVASARAALFAWRAALGHARVHGRSTVTSADLMFAARTVLAPRATQVPPPPDAPDARDETPPPPPDDDHTSDDQDDQAQEPGAIEDRVLEAALAALPPDVLAQIAGGTAGRKGGPNRSGSGERRKSVTRGRPKGVIAGIPRAGRRLSLIDTLRAAAPWQGVRGRQGRIAVRKDDLRVRRFESRAEVLTIFAVDASGSAAMARLAEAKGAVELLLAQAYVRRAHVALIAFRRTSAEVLLPPTRSLTRARRMLGELPGGGGTPLAAGLTTAHALAEAARAAGRTPFIVVLTDGRANIAADGRAVRAQAQADAMAAAATIARSGIGAAFVDTSARPRAEGAELATAMRARYLPLPRADASAVHAAIAQAQPQ
jgi:magnesium chelatase subunit D